MSKILVLVVGFATFLCACGNNYNNNSGNPPPLPVTVSITPASVSVQTGSSVQFTATVNNSSNTSVTWQVNGTTGGSSASGMITTGGLYTAPATVPSAAVTVTAIAQADMTVSASAAVTVTAATAKVSISPGTATVLAGATQQFTATVTGVSTTAVTWQVNGTTGGSPSAGTISAAGLYTAPAIPPAHEGVTVTAISQANSADSASAAVTVAPSVATLSGTYAFSFKGYNSLGLLIEAGSFTADGKGKVTSGEEDVNSGAGVFSAVPVTGTYTVGTDGRASLVLTPSGSSGLNPEGFDLVITSGAHARLIRYDGFATGIGEVDLQDSSAFNPAALKGNLVISLDGIDVTGTLAADASIGLLAFDGSSAVSSGSLDVNDNGSTSTGNAVTGTYTVDSPTSNGRGELTLTGSAGTFDFAFYIVSAGQIRLVSADASPVWGGAGAVQTLSTFTEASLHSGLVFLARGLNGSGELVDAGQFISTSAGSIVDGTGDENSNGSVVSASPFTGTYTVGANGYGTLQLTGTALGNSDYTFYLTAAGQGALLRTDSSVATIGTLNGQSKTEFTLTDIDASPFGFTLDGVSSVGPVDKLGQISLATGGKGTEDVNSNTVLNSNISITSTQAVSSNGVGKLTITGGGATRVVDFYLISPAQMMLIGLDTDQALYGGAEQQFP